MANTATLYGNSLVDKHSHEATGDPPSYQGNSPHSKYITQ